MNLISTIDEQEELQLCFTDFKYFLRRYIKVYTPYSVDFKDYVMSDAIDTASNSFIEDDVTLLTGDRQVGMSTLLVAYMVWYSIFNNDKTILVLCTNSTMHHMLIDMFMATRLQLPEWFKSDIQYNQATNTIISNSNNVKINFCSNIKHSIDKQQFRGINIDLIVSDNSAWLPDDTYDILMRSYYIRPNITKIICGSTGYPSDVYTGVQYLHLSKYYKKITNVVMDTCSGKR
jgi:hypothetical protein